MTTTTVFTEYPEACGSLVITMALASGALKRKDWRLARALLDEELRIFLRSPVMTPEERTWMIEAVGRAAKK